MKQISITIFLTLFLFSVFGQPDDNFERLKNKYGEHNAIITNTSFDYLFDLKDDSLLIRQTNSKEVLVLKENAKMFTNDYIYYGAFTGISNKEAYSLIPEGKKYRKVKVRKFKESHDRDGSIFYDDSKTIQFSFPSVQERVKTSLSYSIDYKNPYFVRKAFLQSFIPILHGRIRAKVHRDIKIGYKLFNNQSGKVKFKQYKKGKYNYYEWEIADQEPYPYTSGDYYSINHFSPHVALYVDETKINGQAKNYFGETIDLYKFYQKFVQRIMNKNSIELQKLVNRITKGKTTHKKIKAIYYWVQRNIKYLAYEQGYMGFVPSPGSEVFTKRFGDCKGMSSIIKEMMHLAGIEGHFSWVGTRHIPYDYNELPLPAVDNHMIASYIEGDSVVLLDATIKFLDYGIYPYHLQGKEVLIGLNSDNYKIFKVPEMPASYSVVTDSVSLNIDGNSLKGRGLRRHVGYNKMELSYALDHVKQKEYEKQLSKLFNKGNNKFQVESYKASNLFEHDSPALVDYEFTLHDYCRSLGDDIYVNLNLDKKYKELKIDTSSSYAPIENDFYFTERFIYTLKIPEGYQLDYLPKGNSFNNKEFGYTIKYTQNANLITMEKVIRFQFLVLLEDKFEQWNKMIKQLSKQYRSTVGLKKIK